MIGSIQRYGRERCSGGRGGQVGPIVLGTKPTGTDCGYNCQELLKRHLQVQKTALAKYPTVVIEDLVRNRRRQTRKSLDHRIQTRLARLNRLEESRRQPISAILDNFPEWYNFALHSSGHELQGLLEPAPKAAPDNLQF